MAETRITMDSNSSYRQRRWLAVSTAVLVILAVVVLAVLFGRSIAARLDAARLVDRATVIATGVDRDVVAVDRAVGAPVDETSSEGKALALKRIPVARAKLQQVVTLTDEAYQPLNDDEREQTLLLKQTAVARLKMLELAEPILATDADASEAATALSTGWDRLLAAKKLSRDAASQYNRLTKPAVAASNRLLAAARSQLTSATAGFEAAGRAFPALDVKPYLAYAATLKELNALAIQSNRAWLKGQTAQANAITARYNRLERQAAREAARLPESPNAAITKAYGDATTRELEAYVAARKQATEADKRLREN